MVGSGFSRNARRIRPDSRPMPMLNELAAHIRRILYPNCEPVKKLPSERILRLAQEYQGEFGPAALHDILRRLVRDDDYVPDSAHKRLIQMPWADVFTTNWDTLLERACKLVPDRSYTIVQSSADIPRGARPRVVKLHGSLPNPPLILTDEDYRRYPFDFAPFVNTVQQAMMETVFLLIGFSGNDPNFIHWAGWVRDNLGEAAPKIYLAGYLNLPRPTRNMLRGRNVIPIDLAEHPRATEWPVNLRHDYSTQWILSSLECGQPYDISKWPTPRSKAFCRDQDPLLQPIVANVSTEPRNEPLQPPSEVEPKDTVAVVTEAMSVWAHNRRNYPGWLVIPAPVRRRLRESTRAWTPLVLKALPQMSPPVQLSAVRELVWRYEGALSRIPKDLAMAANEAFIWAEHTSRTIASREDEANDWTSIRRSSREIGLALLTEARYRMDATEFQMRLGTLEPLLNDDPDVQNRVHHERCLWALWSLDYKMLSERLGKWRTTEGDPAWMLRKSALLREVGRDKEATRLSEKTLETIRSVPNDGQDLRVPSREGWALWSVLDFSTYSNVHTEWSKLAPIKCDPSMELTYLSRELEGNFVDENPPSFDLGVRTQQSSLFFTPDISTTAYHSLRLSEVGGLPPFVNSTFGVAGPLLKLAAENLFTADPGLAIRHILRVTRYDQGKGLKRAFSRQRVAALEESTARTVAGCSRTLVRYSIAQIEATAPNRNVFWFERARVAMEGLSRLVLRLDGVTIDEVFGEALDLYRKPQIASEFWFHQPLRNLIRRSWESLLDEQRAERLLDVLETPIVGTDGLRTQSRHFPDPGEVVSADDRAPKRTKENNSRWASIVGELVRNLGIEGMARERAASRLGSIAFLNRLTNAEEAKIADALWDSRFGGDGDLPGGTNFFDFAFIVLPQPTEGVGRHVFGRKWLGGDVPDRALADPLDRVTSAGLAITKRDPKNVDDILWQTGLSIPFLRRHGHSLALKPEEKEYLIRVIEQWIEISVTGMSTVDQYTLGGWKQSLERACDGLSWMLSELQIRPPLTGQMYKKVQELIDEGIPSYGLLPGIANGEPALSDEVALLMSTGLVSDDEDGARNSLFGLHRWMLWASDSALAFASPPEYLVQEIGIAIATRRRTILAEALYTAKWVFSEGGETYRRKIEDLVLKGMSYLTEELRYDREEPFGVEFDVPRARWRCAQVARAMAKRGLGERAVVRKWLEMGRDDPLPEVRRVAASWRVATAVGSVSDGERRCGQSRDSHTAAVDADGDSEGTG